ncbi:MAG TPA: lipoprotein LpqH [Mycobacterium sp.]|jgi:lipoprotein LpqH
MVRRFVTGRDDKRETAVKRGFVIVVGGAAIVVAGLAGCSDNKASSGGSTAAAGKGSAKVTVDGNDQSIKGDIGCVTTGDRVVMSVGDQSKGVVGATIVGNDVETVGIILNGQPLGYTKGVPGGEATLKKDGSKYSITGNLTGAPDMSNPMAGPSKHPFSMEVTCPS